MVILVGGSENACLIDGVEVGFARQEAAQSPD
jgi:hypothetical protein